MPIKRIRFCCLYSFLIDCGSIVPITWLMLKIIGYPGAWIAKVVSMAVVSFAAFIYIWKCGEGSAFSDKMLLLPESFGIPTEDELSATYSSTEEIEDVSKIAVAFALEHGADQDRSLRYGLMVEELAEVLSEHGLSDGKEHHVNVRLVAKDEDLLIRMRDDCKAFNISEYYQHLQENKEKDMSLDILMNMAKEVKYAFTFGANSIIVRL